MEEFSQTGSFTERVSLKSLPHLFEFFALQYVPVHHFREDFIGRERTQGTQNRGPEIFAIYAFFCGKIVRWRLRRPALFCGSSTAGFRCAPVKLGASWVRVPPVELGDSRPKSAVRDEAARPNHKRDGV